MTIRIYRDRIELGDFVLRETADGASFNGEVAAQQFLGNAFQGTVAGFTVGGYLSINTIDKFLFATDGNAVDVGDLSQGRNSAAGQSSSTHGYTSGGEVGPPPGPSNTIDKFPFATDTNATDVGDLTQARGGGGSLAGQSSSTHGFTSGGNTPPGVLNTIDKFPFATDTNAIDVGDLSQSRAVVSGQSSFSSGYTSGGTTVFSPAEIYVNTIDKFPFAANTNATDVGDLSAVKSATSGQSSVVSGYISGGRSPITLNTIDKFPFATDTNATDIGDLTVARQYSTGQSSTNFGYSSGGPSFNVIDKFPFSADSNATDVGDLTQARASSTGTQD